MSYAAAPTMSYAAPTMSYVAAPEAFAPAVAQAPSMYLPTTQSMVAYPQAYGAYPGFQFTAAPATTTSALVTTAAATTQIKLSATVNDLAKFNADELVKNLSEKMGLNNSQVTATTKYKINVTYSFDAAVNDTQITEIKKEIAKKMDVNEADVTLTRVTTRRLQEHGESRNLASTTKLMLQIISANKENASKVKNSLSSSSQTMKDALTSQGLTADVSVTEPVTSVDVVLVVVADSVTMPTEDELNSIATEYGVTKIQGSVDGTPLLRDTGSAPHGGIAFAVAAIACIAAAVATEGF